MLITWNTNVNAPCCPGEIVAADGRTLLADNDYDWPGVAESFGWSIRLVQQSGREHYPARVDCDHAWSDGSIDCLECGVTSGEFIAAARDWLAEHNDVTADDPGYFA